MDLAELGIKASTQGVTQATQEIDRLNTASGRVSTTLGGLTGSSREAGTATGLMGNQIGGLSSLFTTLNPAILGAIAALAGFVAGAVTLQAFVDATVDAEYQQAQLAAALKSTGSASGQTIESLNAHAAALQEISNYEDDTISKSQALLLTFTKIGGDVFPKATEAVLDLAQRMGGDLQGATIQVGKALNNPIQGITALSRAGIQFTEDQKAMIKTMVEANNIVGAQTVILKELETQFGGSAEAARATLGGAIQSLGNAFGNLFEISGPATEDLRVAIEGLIKSISDPAFKDFASFIGESLFKALQVTVEGFSMLAQGVSSFWAYAGPTIREFVDMLVHLGSIVVPAIGEAFTVLWNIVKPIIQYFLEGWKQVYEVVKQVIDLMNTAPEVPTATAPTPATASAAAKPIADAGEDAAKDIAGAMNTGATKTATAINTANAAGAKTEIDTAKQAAEIGAGALTNSFGAGAKAVGGSVTGAGADAGDTIGAAIAANAQVMAAKFEGTGRNIYDLWNNWGDAFIDSFGTSIGDLLIDFQQAQTAQLQAQARLANAQAALVAEQFHRLQNYGEQPGSGGSSGGGGGDNTSSGGFNFGDVLNGNNDNRSDRRHRRTTSNDNTDKKDRNVKLDERGNVEVNIINQNDPKDSLDNINTSAGGRVILNALNTHRHAARAILGVKN